MHQILEEQIRKHLGKSPAITPRWQNFLNSISKTYENFDEDKYHNLVETMDEGLGVQDNHGIITFMNKRGCIMLGYKAEELIGKPVSILFDDKNFKIIQEQMRKRKKGEKESYEVEWLRKDGVNIPTIVTPSPQFDKNGNLVGSVAVFTDISKRIKEEKRILDEKKKEERFAKDLEKFKLAVDNASDQIIITDPDGIVLYGNKSIQEEIGYSLEEILGKKVGVMWKKPMPKEYYVKLWETIKAKKQPFHGEITNKKKNGEEYVASMTVYPVLDNNKDILYFVSIERNITKEKEIDKAKTEFVSIASHQLRTPLTTIKWYTEMLLTGDVGSLTKDQKKYLEEIHKGNQNMVSLIDALLNVSRIELGTFIIEPTAVNIEKLIQSEIHEQQPKIDEKNINLTTSFEGDIPTILIDPKLLCIVIQNLLSNAIKYTAEKGKINVSLSNQDNKNLIFKISDDGCGIPSSQQDKVFTKLFRADNVKKSNTEGTGLGLYIVKSIIEHSGGNIWFESHENDGTTFYVKIPIKTAS